MSSSDLWRYSLICSALIILMGSLEIVGIWSVGEENNLAFGIGIIIVGGVMTVVSSIGYVEARMDEVQEILDGIESDMYLYIKGNTERKDPEEKP